MSQRLWRYFSRELGWGESHQSRVVFDFLLGAARAASGGVVLDVGAGTQRYKPFFAESLYLAQEHPAGVAAKRLRDYHILADAARIPLRDESVDLVLSTVSVEHLRYPERFFAEAFRVLKPGGSLRVQAPFVYHEHEAPHDYQRPTRYGLLRWFEDAGFERMEVSPSSSSTAAALCFVTYALEEDIRRRGRATRWLGRRVTRAAGALTRGVVRLFDRGPMPDTTLPVGWISVGWRPGARPAVGPLLSPAEFLSGHRLDDPRAVLVDGVLTLRELDPPA